MRPIDGDKLLDWLQNAASYDESTKKMILAVHEVLERQISTGTFDIKMDEK